MLALRTINHRGAMASVRGLLSGIDHHTFYVLAAGLDCSEVGDFDFKAHLLGSSDAALNVRTGIAMGVIDLEIRTLDIPPFELDSTAPWQAVAEATFAPDSTQVSIGLNLDAPPREFLELALPRSRRYRARAHALGRDTGYDAVAREPNGEQHLIQIWPVDATEPAVDLKTDDPWSRQR